MFSHLGNSVSNAILVLACLLPSLCLARIYPVRQSNSELIVVHDSSVEMALRLRLFSMAQSSIDIISLAQGADSLGITMTDGLREAANRGVAIRNVHDSFASRNLASNGRGIVEALLSDSALRNPAKVLVVDGDTKARMNWSWKDYFHEKIIIIDAGTPREMILISGRNQIQIDLSSKDMGYLIRPIDPKQEYIGTDLKTHFNGIWELLSSYKQHSKPQPLSPRLSEFDHNAPREKLIWHQAQLEELNTILDLIHLPTFPNESLSHIQFRPQQLQLLSNDVLSQVTALGKSVSFRERFNLHNDILSTLISRIGSVSQIDLLTYLLNLHPDLTHSLKHYLNLGGKLNIYSNGRNSLANMHVANPVIRRIVTKLGLLASAVDITYLESLGLFIDTPLQIHKNFQLYLLDHAFVTNTEPSHKRQTFQHTKLALFPDSGMIGSDNFTSSSHAHNSEIMIHFGDTRLADYLRADLHTQNRHYKHVTPLEIRKDFQKRPKVSDYCRELLREMF